MPIAPPHAATPPAVQVADMSPTKSIQVAELSSCEMPDPESVQYSHSVANALSSDCGQYSSCRYVAVTLELGDPVDGDMNYRALADRLAASDQFGQNYRSKISIIGPRRV